MSSISSFNFQGGQTPKKESWRFNTSKDTGGDLSLHGTDLTIVVKLMMYRPPRIFPNHTMAAKSSPFLKDRRNNTELKEERLLNVMTLVDRVPARAGKIRDGEFMSRLPEQLPAFPLHFAPLGYCLNKEMMLERQTAP